MFNDTPVNVRKCTHILTKILYLINQVCVTIPVGVDDSAMNFLFLNENHKRFDFTG